MKRSTLKILAGVFALAAASSAFADMALKPGDPGPGSIFVSVIDLSNSTSFTYDTGKTLSSLSALSANLSTDSNWTTFSSGITAGDVVVYQVQGVNTPSSQQYVLDMSSNAATGTTVGKLGSINNSDIFNITPVNNFINNVNSITQSSTTSVFGSSTVNQTAYAGDQLSLGSLNVSARANLGTAISFYQWVLGSNPSNNLQKAVFSALGTWTLTTGGLLTFVSSAAAVPLPPSVILLLSGAVLMALISRRRPTNGLLSMGTPA